MAVPTEYGIDQKAAEASGRLVQHSIDMATLSTQGALFADHTHSFCLLGTTRKDAGSAVRTISSPVIFVSSKSWSLVQNPRRLFFS